MKIEFLYFEGCPSYKEALANLKAALAEAGVAEEPELVNVGSPEEAAEVGFYGSPSIRVDGEDLEGRTGDPIYSCRIYEIDGKQTGVPGKDYIRDLLLKRPEKKLTGSGNGDCACCQ